MLNRYRVVKLYRGFESLRLRQNRSNDKRNEHAEGTSPYRTGVLTLACNLNLRVGNLRFGSGRSGAERIAIVSKGPKAPA